MKTQINKGESTVASPGVKNNTDITSDIENSNTQNVNTNTQTIENSYDADDWFNESAI